MKEQKVSQPQNPCYPYPLAPSDLDWFIKWGDMKSSDWASEDLSGIVPLLESQRKIIYLSPHAVKEGIKAVEIIEFISTFGRSGMKILSRAEIKKLIKSNAIKLNGNKITDISFNIISEHLEYNSSINAAFLEIGKQKWFLLKTQLPKE